MLDLLLALATVVVLVALLVLVVVAASVVPFVVALHDADRRHLSPVRVGAAVLVASLLGLALAAWLTFGTPVPGSLAALALLLGWVAAVVVRATPRRVWGRRGVHERV